MDIEGRKVLVLGGYGLVGMAVCREILARNPSEVQIHSLRVEESERAVSELQAEANGAQLRVSAGDIFSLQGTVSLAANLRSQIDVLKEETLAGFLLYELLKEAKPDIVVDCVNTATGIAYLDIYSAAGRVQEQLESGSLSDAAVEELLGALYIPRLTRHIQVLYRGMIDAGTRVYVKVGTSGTGGMGLNIPYTHSEERPSRVLLSKSALAGAHSMLLFLMARTPGAPITKEIKPAAAIAWKSIGFGPIHRKGQPIYLVDTEPAPLGETFSTIDPQAARLRNEVLESVYIDTGENGIFSLEEFAALTTAEQMEFVTPEEIARNLIFEIEGGNTGHDVINALDNAVLGPTYRAGLLRHWALERMIELEEEHGVHSVAFEMLGPPRITKLLFEAHLIRLAFESMIEVRTSSAEEVCERLHRLIRESPDVANELVAVGIPILLDSGEIVRGQRVLIPSEAQEEPVTPQKLNAWVHDGWADLRMENCRLWVDRFERIYKETKSIPEADTSSRHLRTRRFWKHGDRIQPGKVVGWVLSVEEQGGRIKH
ncbi:MAG: short-chain dehydrogenase [Deltaproteobacteria bacterium]|nr:short-chain dehydrogenase [Deltaproteobacteria bacterium]